MTKTFSRAPTTITKFQINRIVLFPIHKQTNIDFYNTRVTKPRFAMNFVEGMKNLCLLINAGARLPNVGTITKTP